MRKRRTRRSAGSERTLEEKLKGLNSPSEDYRHQSLALYGWICAKCGKEFDQSDLHLLTVHHRDGNPRNNPKDGSNWENLCVYCHDDAHSRGLLGEYLEEKDS
jgi:5-methylcytosine-specific restriction endonuclease McrA